MRPQQRSRRQFLIQSVAGLGGAWVAANYAGIMEAQAFVQQAASSGQPIKLAFLTEAQAAEVDAMAAQIIVEFNLQLPRDRELIRQLTFVRVQQGHLGR